MRGSLNINIWVSLLIGELKNREAEGQMNRRRKGEDQVLFSELVVCVYHFLGQPRKTELLSQEKQLAGQQHRALLLWKEHFTLTKVCLGRAAVLHYSPTVREEKHGESPKNLPVEDNTLVLLRF